MLKYLVTTFAFSLLVATSGPAIATKSIVALVNDEPVSAYDVDQRVRFIQMSSGKKVGKAQRKKILEELINERLQLQEAERLNVLASDSEVDQVISGLAKRNKMSPAQLKETFARRGVKIDTLRQRMRAQFSWRNVIRQRYGASVYIGDQQIDKAISRQQTKMAKPADGKASVRFDLKRIRINIRNFQDQGEIARKLVVADNLRNRFSHCDAIKNLVDGIDGAAVKDVGKKTSEQFPMPLKSLLIATDAGKMTPPQITSGGIEVYAVCQRQDIASNNKQRAEVKSRLRQQEFQLLARRHLRDLRQDAFVEYK